MAITFGKTNGAQGGSGDGIFFDVAEIVKVQPFYKASPDYLNKPNDVGIKVSYKPEGKELSFTPDFYVGGNLKRNDLEVVIGVGGAFKVQILFEEAGLEFKLNDDETIPDELLESLIGKKVLILNYRNTRSDSEKLRTSTYSIVAKPGSEDYLRSRFLKDVADGWVSNYQGEMDPVSQTFGLPAPF